MTSTLAAQPPVRLAGGVIATADCSISLPGHALLEIAATNNNTPIYEEKAFTNARTQANFVKTIRALKLCILKQTANATISFLGPGSKTMSIIFVLKKFPSSVKALQILLPFSLGRPCEGIFVKTAKGKKVLSVTFGKGDMSEDMLIKNATAVAAAVHKSLGVRPVEEVVVAADKLELPVFNKKLFHVGKKKKSSTLSYRSAVKRGCMAPPFDIPVKKVKIS